MDVVFDSSTCGPLILTASSIGCVVSLLGVASFLINALSPSSPLATMYPTERTFNHYFFQFLRALVSLHCLSGVDRFDILPVTCLPTSVLTPSVHNTLYVGRFLQWKWIGIGLYGFTDEILCKKDSGVRWRPSVLYGIMFISGYVIIWSFMFVWLRTLRVIAELGDRIYIFFLWTLNATTLFLVVFAILQWILRQRWSLSIFIAFVFAIMVLYVILSLVLLSSLCTRKSFPRQVLDRFRTILIKVTIISTGYFLYNIIAAYSGVLLLVNPTEAISNFNFLFFFGTMFDLVPCAAVIIMFHGRLSASTSSPTSISFVNRPLLSDSLENGSFSTSGRNLRVKDHPPSPSLQRTDIHDSQVQILRSTHYNSINDPGSNSDSANSLISPSTFMNRNIRSVITSHSASSLSSSLSEVSTSEK